MNLDMPVKEFKLADQILLEIMRGFFIVPRLLVLDESLEKLTSRNLTRVAALLKEHADCGNAVLFITHSIDDIFRLANRVSVIKKGDIVLTEPVESMGKLSLIKMAYTQYPVSADESTTVDSEFYHLLKYNQAILDNLPVNLIAVNNEGILKLINTYASTFFRCERTSVWGMSIKEFFDGENDLLTAIESIRHQDRMGTLFHRVLSSKCGNKIVNVTIVHIQD